MLNLHVILLAWRNPGAALAQYRILKRWSRIPLKVTLVYNEALQTCELEPDDRAIALEKNEGYAGGHNKALSQIEPGAGAVLLLNNDVKVHEEAVLTLIHHLEEHPDIGVIGPVLEENESRSYGGRDPLRHIATRCHTPPPSHPTLLDVDYAPGTVLLFDPAILKKTGLLDEQFFFSGEIADFCHRVRSNGYRCVVALDAVARHEADDGTGLRATLYRYYTLRNRFLFARKRTRSLWIAWGLYWTVIGLAMWIKACVNNREAARAIRWALRDGWTGTFGNRHDRFA
jgi:hypothetical protein